VIGHGATRQQGWINWRKDKLTGATRCPVRTAEQKRLAVQCLPRNPDALRGTIKRLQGARVPAFDPRGKRLVLLETRPIAFTPQPDLAILNYSAHDITSNNRASLIKWPIWQVWKAAIRAAAGPGRGRH
jgi:hypothetical protein